MKLKRLHATALRARAQSQDEAPQQIGYEISRLSMLAYPAVPENVATALQALWSAALAFALKFEVVRRSVWGAEVGTGST